MANEKRLIDANAIYDAVERRYQVSSGIEHRCERDLLDLICSADTVDAVEVKQYETLLEMYNELRENFIDYVCSGIPNVAPYCLNKCEECVDKWGWCKQYSDHCKGFNPAEYIPDGERKDNGES